MVWPRRPVAVGKPECVMLTVDCGTGTIVRVEVSVRGTAETSRSRKEIVNTVKDTLMARLGAGRSDHAPGTGRESRRGKTKFQRECREI